MRVCSKPPHACVRMHKRPIGRAEVNPEEAVTNKNMLVSPVVVERRSAVRFSAYNQRPSMNKAAFKNTKHNNPLPLLRRKGGFNINISLKHNKLKTYTTHRVDSFKYNPQKKLNKLLH